MTFLRAVLLVSVFFMSDIGLSVGKLTFRPSYVINDNRPKYSLGLTAYEKVAESTYFTAWLGYGEADALLGDQWVKARAGIDYHYKGASIELGVSHQHNYDKIFDETEAYGSITYTIW